MVLDQAPDFENKRPEIFDEEEEKKGKELTENEEKEWREGQALYEMVTGNTGWQVIKKWLEDMAYHTWIDPRETKNKEEWEWRELNGFHASNNAKELLIRIDEMIQRSEYLSRVRSGEIQVKSFKI